MSNMHQEVRVEAKKVEQGQSNKLIWMIWFVFGAALFSINFANGSSGETTDQLEAISYGMN